MSKNTPFAPSTRVRQLQQALSIYFNQIVYQLKRKGSKICTLSLGEAYFDLPPLDFSGLDIEKGYHYSDSQGIPGLREKIASYYNETYHSSIEANDVLVSAGSKPIIYMCLLVATDRDDEVLIHEPSWLSYVEQIRLAGCTPRYVPYNVTVDSFAAHFTSRTRVLIINNPNNPAGRLYTAHELAMLHSFCRERGVFMIMDESYSEFVRDQVFPSLLAIAPDKTNYFVVNSLSKNFGMSGWRIGYAITCPDLLAPLLKVNQHLLTCGPTLLLDYVANNFDKIKEATRPQIKAVVEKRQVILAELSRLGIETLPGTGTFYFFVDVDRYPHSTMDLALDLLLHHHIAVVPGIAYGASTDRFIRLSVGTEPVDEIFVALRVLQSKLQPDEPRPIFAADLAALGIAPWSPS